MLTLQINNPDIELEVSLLFSENTVILTQTFNAFVQQKRIKKDIRQSLKDCEQGEGFELADVMQHIRLKYK